MICENNKSIENPGPKSFLVQDQFAYKKTYISILIFIFFILRLFLILKTPVSWDPDSTKLQAFNDEASHVNYVRFLMQHRSLPVQTHHIQEKNAFVLNEFEYYQPPLSYILMSLTASLFSISHQGDQITYFCRVMNSVLGIFSILMLFSFLKKTIPIRTALFLTALYGFLPVHWRHTSAFSNDALLWIFTISLMFFIHKKLNHSVKISDYFFEGCILGLGLWTKSSMMTWILFYFLFGVLYRKHWKPWIIPALTGLLIALPYFIRNLILYHELLGTRISCGPQNPALMTLSPVLFFKFFRGILINFIFPFDTMYIPFVLRMPAYLMWAVLWGLFFGQFLKTNYREIKNRSFTSMNMIFSGMILMAFCALIYYNLYTFQTEFRHVFYIMPLILWLSGQWFKNGNKVRLKWFIFASVLYTLILTLCKIILNL